MRRVSAILLVGCYLSTNFFFQSTFLQKPGGHSISEKNPPFEIIVDGPWTIAPDNLESQIAWDRDSGALTLQTNSVQMVFVAIPDPNKDAFTNNIYSLGKYNSTLYLGYGDMYNNQGPLNIISYDPYSASIKINAKSLPEDQIGSWFESEDGTFYVTGADSREPWAFGNYYAYNGVDWHKVRTLYRGLHVGLIVEMSGRIYAAFGSDNQKIVDYPYILVSDDHGLTWQYEKLDNDTSQDCSISQMAVVPNSVGEGLYVIANIINPPERNAPRLYHYDGGKWERENFGKSEDEFRIRDIFSYQGYLLITAYEVDPQSGKWTVSTFSWDGDVLTEIPYLRDRNSDLSLFTEKDARLYALIPEVHTNPNNPAYQFVRTSNLSDWEMLGSLNLPEGVIPGDIIFLHNRLYLAGRIAWEEIEGNPRVYTLVMTQAQPLKNAKISWDADISSGASLSFQVRSGKDYEEFSSAQFIGPDGTSGSFYTTSGQALAAQQADAIVYMIKMWKKPNAGGKDPFVRTVTLNSDNGSTTYAIDEGSGLYASVNAEESAQFTSRVFELKDPLSDGGIFFNAEIPPETGVAFQIRSGKTQAELEKMVFVGPDGGSGSFYTENTSALWNGHNGALFIQYRAYLSSDNLAVAPFLRQVSLVNGKGNLDQLRVQVDSPSSLTAGSAFPLQISILASNGQNLPINGEILVSAINEKKSVSIKPDHILLNNGIGNSELFLLQAGKTQICLNIAGKNICSLDFKVIPGKAEKFLIETPDLSSGSQFSSPHIELNQLFTLLIKIQDSYGNPVDNYSGTMHCESWKWQVLDPQFIPDYVFLAEEKGNHRFEKAASFSAPGEYSIVCRDNDDPTIGGSLAITVGEFDDTLFP